MELNWVECNLVWNPMRDFKIKQARLVSLVLNNTYNFRPKLHDTKFIYHFIPSSYTNFWYFEVKNLVAQIQVLLNIYKYGPVLVSL